MKKPYRHDERSDRHFCIAPGCNRAIKLNLIERKQRVPKLCYEH